MPHLLCVSQEYLDARVRVMFVGKETNGWYGRLFSYYDGTCSITDLLGRYWDQMSEAGGHGAFLHSLDRIAHEFTGATRKSIIWANLMKMDWYQGRKDNRNSVKHSKQLRDFSQAVLRFEVGLLKPDIILFGTGGTRPYDDAIKATFLNRSNSQVLVRKALWQFDIEDIACDRKIACCRLRHPQARVDVKRAFKPTQVYYDQAFELLKSRIYIDARPEDHSAALVSLRYRTFCSLNDMMAPNEPACSVMYRTGLSQIFQSMPAF